MQSTVATPPSPVVIVFTGWKLEFLDNGDMTPTYAGVFRSVEAAQAEAAR